MNLFLAGQGQPLPQLATVKSPSAVSRFFNHYNWNIRAVIRALSRGQKWDEGVRSRLLYGVFCYEEHPEPTSSV